MKLSTCSFICHDISARRREKNFYGLRIKLPPTIFLTTQERGVPLSVFSRDTIIKLGSCELLILNSFDMNRRKNRIQISWLRDGWMF